jgi:acetyltransferase-like isoleucine patch superfamily enzyme
VSRGDGIVRGALEALVRRVKRDPAYALHPDTATVDLLASVWHRATCLVRAQWRLVGVDGPALRFAEAGVHIRHRRRCHLGRASVVEANADLSCLSREGFWIGDRVTIGKFAVVECSGVLWNLGRGLRVGDDSSIGDHAVIGCSGGVTIGERVLMGPRVAIHSQNHRHDRTDVPIQSQGVTQEGVTIGDDCWLGSGAVILDGVTLGEGCVVAAGAVVTRSFPPYTVIAGVPARAIADRTVTSSPVATPAGAIPAGVPVDVIW